MNRRLPLLVFAGACIAAWSWLGSAAVAAPPPQGTEKAAEIPPLQKFMRAKLKASNQILEGLVSEKFDLVAEGAKTFQSMSKAEQWRVSNDALYRQYSSEFLRIAERLEKQAKEEKLDAAALTWIEATMSCIECHKHARAILMADQ